MKKILLTQGKEALVDDCDYDWLMQWKWCYMSIRGGDGYAVRNKKPKGSGLLLMHRAIMQHAGCLEVGQVDHWDQNKLNNQRYNLRMATRSQQQANVPPQKNNKCGFKGVRWNERDRLWYAQIMSNKEYKYLGCFDSAEEAARAYDKQAKIDFGEFAYLNFPKEK
jgi:hypothetical protein